MTEKVGEKYHLDFGDCEGSYTLAALMGEWPAGGELELPTLGLKFSLPPGLATFSCAKSLPHWVTPYEGGSEDDGTTQRLSINLATCQNALFGLYK